MTIQEKFEQWLNANPHAVEMFLRYAREAKQRGFTKYGIGAIAELVRWDLNKSFTKTDRFKLNNIYRSRLARHLVKIDPSLEGFFETRTLKTA